MTRTLLTQLAGGHRAPRLACGLAMVALLASPGPAAADEPGQDSVTVTKTDAGYVVRAQFAVPHPAADVIEVLTDYDGIPRFLPDIRRSVVRSREGSRTTVEQEAVSSVMMFSRRVHLLLEIDETSDALVFRDTSGRSFERYEGAWRVSPSGDATLVRYELQAKPAFFVPEFVLMRLFRRDSRETITRIIAEIARRSRPAAFTSR
jgi:ribosome-associated toxin RatA of RatAB toxin-antitoxin module